MEEAARLRWRAKWITAVNAVLGAWLLVGGINGVLAAEGAVRVVSAFTLVMVGVVAALTIAVRRRFLAAADIAEPSA